VRGLVWLLSRGRRAATGEERVERGALAPTISEGAGTVASPS